MFVIRVALYVCAFICEVLVSWTFSGGAETFEVSLKYPNYLKSYIKSCIGAQTLNITFWESHMTFSNLVLKFK